MTFDAARLRPLWYKAGRPFTETTMPRRVPSKLRVDDTASGEWSVFGDGFSHQDAVRCILPTAGDMVPDHVPLRREVTVKDQTTGETKTYHCVARVVWDIAPQPDGD